MLCPLSCFNPLSPAHVFPVSPASWRTCFKAQSFPVHTCAQQRLLPKVPFAAFQRWVLPVLSKDDLVEIVSSTQDSWENLFFSRPGFTGWWSENTACYLGASPEFMKLHCGLKWSAFMTISCHKNNMHSLCVNKFSSSLLILKHCYLYGPRIFKISVG